MSEDTQLETQEASQEVELTPTQQKAMEQGWKPKEQFEGDEDSFVDAPEFIRRGELFSKIEHQSKELKNVKQALEAFKTHYGNVEKAAFDRAVKSLQEQRKQAFVDGDTDRAFAIEEQIDDAKEQAAQAAQRARQPAVQEINPEFAAWSEKNTWYNTDKRMRAVADKIGLDLAAEGVSPSEVLKRVVEEVKDAFPHKFTNPQRDKPNAVEGTSRTGSSVQRGNVAMDAVQKDIMRKIVRSGVMTEAQYLAEFKKTQG